MPVLQALVAALAFALSAPLAKLLLGDVPPLLLAGLLYLGAGLFLSLLSIVRSRRAANRGFAGHERWLLAGAVTAGGIVAPPLLLWGLSQSPASATALLLNLEVLFTALMAGIVWREHLGRHVIGAAVLHDGRRCLARLARAHTHDAGVHTHRHVHDEHHQHEHEGWEGPEPHAHPHAMGPIGHSHPHVHGEHHRHLHP